MTHLSHHVTATEGEEWLMEVRSRSLRLWCIISAVIVLAIHIFMGLVVDSGNTGASVTFIDKLAFPLIGVIIAGVFLLGTRARMRVSARGVEVRNLLAPRFYPWSQIYGLSFPKKAKWARLELPDFEFVPILAVQSADGESVVKTIAQFREYEAQYMPQD